MNPTPGDIYYSQPLTNISVAFMQDQAQFIADKVFPVVPVAAQAGQYWQYTQGDWYRSEAKVRAPATPTVGGGWNTSRGTYAAEVYGIHKDVDDQTLANAQAYGQFNLERDASLYVSEQMLLTREIVWTQKYFTTGIWGTDITGVAGVPAGGQVKQWDAAGSTPLEDVKSAVVAMAQTTGRKPNFLVLGPLVEQALSNHAEILDRIKYTQRGIITTDLYAAFFGVDNVYTPYVVQNTANEGATDAYSYLFGKSALLGYAAPNPGPLTPTAGYTFSWNGYLGAQATGGRIKRFRIEEIAATRVECEMAFDLKVVAPTLGRFYTSLVS